MGAGFPSRWLIKKDLLKKVYGFDEGFPSMQDIELSYRLAEHEVFVLHNDIVTVIYPTYNSVSTSSENAIKGKVMLMERLRAKIPPAESALWYYSIAKSNFSLKKYDKAIYFFRKAFQSEKLIRLKIALIYSHIARLFAFLVILRKAHLNVFSILYNYEIKPIVHHHVV